MLRHNRPRTPALVSGALLAAVLAAVAVVLLAGGEAASKTPRVSRGAGPRPGIDATTGPEARQIRHATLVLADDMGAAARCDPALARPRFAACVAPALRHADIGGRTNAMLLRTVLAPVTAGPCRTYLAGLQAANDAAGDSARWLLPQLYVVGGRPAQRHIRGQIALDARMLRRAAGGARSEVCSQHAGPPAI
jgi:hypothetical protein